MHPCAEQFMDVKRSLGQKLPNGNLKPDIYGAWMSNKEETNARVYCWFCIWNIYIYIYIYIYI